LVLQNQTESDLTTPVGEIMITIKEQVTKNLDQIIIEGKERQSSTEKKQLDENVLNLRA